MFVQHLGILKTLSKVVTFTLTVLLCKEYKVFVGGRVLCVNSLN